MKMPQHRPATPRAQDKAVRPHDRHEGVTQAGCCVQVCAPIVGCHCVVEAPFC